MNSPGLSGAPEPGVGSSPEPFDHRLGQPVPEAEVVVRVVERRRRVEIEERQLRTPSEPGHQLVVHSGGPRMLGVVAGEQDRDGVQVLTRQPADPVVRMGGPGVAEDVRAGRHALAGTRRGKWPAILRVHPGRAGRSR